MSTASLPAPLSALQIYTLIQLAKGPLTFSDHSASAVRPPVEHGFAASIGTGCYEITPAGRHHVAVRTLKAK
jgi:hypothetical protein